MHILPAAALSLFSAAVDLENCATSYSQCGGQNWNGPTCCESPFVCTVVNPYYSQCLAPSSGSTSTATLSTTAPSGTATTSTISTSTPAPSPKPHDNPFVGAQQYINPEYTQQVQDSIDLDPSITLKAQGVMKQPTAIWIDTIANLDRVRTHLPLASKAATAKNPIVISFVVYDLPGRDCHALASNGEIATGQLAKYKKDYIEVFASILSKNKNPNVRVVLIIEPDSLPNIATNLQSTPKCADAADDYYNGVAYALATLSAIPNTFLYIDAAHGGWLGWENNAKAIVPIFEKAIKLAKTMNPSTKITGFSTSVSNYSPFYGNGTTPATRDCPPPLQVQNGIPVCQGNAAVDEDNYTRILAKAFESSDMLPARFIVDTSRSGVASVRKIWGSWCNLKGAGIGSRPVAEPSTLIDAFVWVKPPGESDGVSGPPGTPRLDGFCDPTTSNGIDSMDGAPQAGSWFHEEFVMLLKNANPSF